MFHGEKSLKTPPLSLKSPGILLKGLLLKVAILAQKKTENVWKILKSSKKISKNNWKNNNPRIPNRIPKKIKKLEKHRKKRNKIHKKQHTKTKI